MRQVHPVGDVPEGTVGLECREFRAVPGVHTLVPEVSGDLEHPLVTPDDQAFEIQLGRDAQAEVDIQRIGVRHERPGQGPTRLGLQDRGVHLDEVFGHQLVAQRRDGLEPDVEHRPGAGVGQEVDLPLAVAGVGL